jgi:hypothetical protein
MRLKRGAPAAVESAAPAAARTTRRTAITALAGAATGAAAVGLFAISRWRGAAPRNLTRFAIALPEGTVAEASGNRRVGISRDGSQVAYMHLAGNLVAL